MTFGHITSHCGHATLFLLRLGEPNCTWLILWGPQSLNTAWGGWPMLGRAGPGESQFGMAWPMGMAWPKHFGFLAFKGRNSMEFNSFIILQWRTFRGPRIEAPHSGHFQSLDAATDGPSCFDSRLFLPITGILGKWPQSSPVTNQVSLATPKYDPLTHRGWQRANLQIRGTRWADRGGGKMEGNGLEMGSNTYENTRKYGIEPKLVEEFLVGWVFRRNTGTQSCFAQT